jgi:hypothetical protein
VVEDNRSAAAQAAQAGPEACSQTQHQTWCSLALEASVAVPSPSWSDSFPTVAVRRRYWRKRHRAGRKKRRPGHHGRAVECIRGLAGPDIVPCRVSSGRGCDHSTRTASGPPPGRRCPLRTGVVGGLAARVLQKRRKRYWRVSQGAVARSGRVGRAALRGGEATASTASSCWRERAWAWTSDADACETASRACVSCGRANQRVLLAGERIHLTMGLKWRWRVTSVQHEGGSLGGCCW